MAWFTAGVAVAVADVEGEPVAEVVTDTEAEEEGDVVTEDERDGRVDAEEEDEEEGDGEGVFAWQEVEPGSELVYEGHAWHAAALTAPDAFEKVFAGHFVQVEDVVAELFALYVPAVHCVQVGFVALVLL